MPIKIILSGTAALFIAFLLFELMPLDILSNWLIAFAIVGGALFAISLGAFLFYLPNLPNLDLFWPKAVISFVSFWVFSIMLLYIQSGRESKELEDHGKYTVGLVLDGTSLSTRRNQTSSIKVIYRTADGEKLKTKTTVGNKEFDNYYKNMEVSILYSERYPSIIRILKTKEEIENYRNRR